MAIKNEKKHFEDVVALETPMTVQEAVAFLAGYHNTSTEAILEAFLNLKNSYNDEGATATFSSRIDADLASFTICDKNGKWVSRSMIDKYTGQPRQHPH